MNEKKIEGKDQGDEIGRDLNGEAPRNDKEINRYRDDDVRVKPESNHLRKDFETKPMNDKKIQEKDQGDEIGRDLNDEAPRNDKEIHRNRHNDVRVRPESNHVRKDFETKPMNEKKIQEKDQGDEIGNDLNDEAPRNDKEINR